MCFPEESNKPYLKLQIAKDGNIPTNEARSLY